MPPIVPEAALSATVRPPEGQTGTVADQLVPKFPASLAQAAKPVARGTFAKLDQDPADTTFHEMFQAAGSNALNVKLTLPVPANQAGTLKGEPTDNERLDFGRDAPSLEQPLVVPANILPEIAKTDSPAVNSTPSPVDRVFTSPPTDRRVPIQTPTALSLLQTAAEPQQATEISDNLQPIKNVATTISPPVDDATIPLVKVTESLINPALAGRVSDTAPNAAAPVAAATIAAKPSPENRALTGLVARDPVGQNKGLELAQPKILEVAPRISTAIQTPPPLASSRVSTATKVDGLKAEKSTPVAHLGSPNAATNTSETDNSDVNQPKALPIAKDSSVIQIEIAPKIDARTPILPVADATISLDETNPNPISKPSPDLEGNDGVLLQALPSKLQPPTPGVFTLQNQPPIAALEVAPQKLQPQRPSPEDQAVQLQPQDASDTTRAPTLSPPVSQATQPLIPDSLASVVSDRPQIDLPISTLAKVDGTPALNTPQLPPVTAKSVAIQIAQAAFSDGSQAIEIALDPVELGKVRLMLHSTETGINVQIFADRPETIDLMRRHAHILEAEFESLGYRDIGFDFSNNSQGDTPESSEDQSNPLGDRDVQIDNAQAIQPNYARGSQSDGGLDLRL